MKIGIIVAMSKELAMLRGLMESPVMEHHGDKDFYRGNIGRHEAVLMQCGIGKVNAAIGCVELINHFAPDMVISSGCAGGNGDDLQVQDIVVSTEICYHDVYCGHAIDNTTQYGQVQGLPARFPADPYMLEKARQLDVHPGLIVTGDWFVDSKAKMRDILSHFPEATAVDMESAAIAQACYLKHVPFISFRVVSDIPLRDTNASMYHNFWDSVAEHSFHTTRTFIESL